MNISHGLLRLRFLIGRRRRRRKYNISIFETHTRKPTGHCSPTRRFSNKPHKISYLNVQCLVSTAHGLRLGFDYLFVLYFILISADFATRRLQREETAAKPIMVVPVHFDRVQHFNNYYCISVRPTFPTDSIITASAAAAVQNNNNM